MTKLEQIQKALEENGIDKDTVSAVLDSIKKFTDEKLEEQSRFLMEKADQALADIQRLFIGRAQAYGNLCSREATARVDEHVQLAMKEFIKESKKEFVEAEDYKRMKSVFNLIKESFEDNGYRINPNTKLSKKLSETTNAFSQLFADHKATKRELALAKQAIIFEDLTGDLTLTQKEKVKKLSEGVSFNGLKEFKRGLALIVESVQKEKSTGKQSSRMESLNEDLKVPTNKRVQAFAEKFI